MINLEDSGIYIVCLTNKIKISNYAGDKRREHRGTPVGLGNFKVGKAKVLKTRRKDYFKTFGEHHVEFIPQFNTADIDNIEQKIKAALKNYRIKGINGRRLEWMENITKEELISIVQSFNANTLSKKKTIYELLDLELDVIEQHLKLKSHFYRKIKDALEILRLSDNFDEAFAKSLSDANLEKIIKVLTFMDQRECFGGVTGIPYLIYLLKLRTNPNVEYINGHTRYWDWGERFNELELWVSKHNIHKNPYLPYVSKT